ncbi:uncharacterized protein PHACADRAFT_248387 [Phanerochaete carnosa HHB-10118-sp]|uniref:Uncharacterized protein n=1 Tax=Phanerochaete carnosa (strain HHB-10118-sp) TaxID=650164 RepID=K5WQX0_PHACS|nr:uncharacterized protein PHACADRAFT_248387 [Phanerochaete carnosa HHB-10118-sp]EKM61654.1 hypothetical protein PHACADRAFT_248387 [Phanerochaete carnosa HHB-10118-sp]
MLATPGAVTASCLKHQVLAALFSVWAVPQARNVPGPCTGPCIVVFSDGIIRKTHGSAAPIVKDYFIATADNAQEVHLDGVRPTSIRRRRPPALAD